MPENIRLSDPDAVLGALDVEEAPDEWRMAWKRSEPSFQPGNLFFLRQGFVREVCDTLRMTGDARGALLAAVGAIAAHPALERLAWHCHWMLFLGSEEYSVRSWPKVAEGKDSALFYALVLLSGLPSLLENNRKRGIDERITINTLSEFTRNLRENAEGVWELRVTEWMKYPFKGKVFLLGRLNFKFDQFEHLFRVYRHVGGKGVVMLPEHGYRFRANGQFVTADGGHEASGDWTSRLVITEDTVRGYVVDPRGYVRTQEVALPTAQWRQVLQKGDDVLSVHIPPTGPLKPDECSDSFRQAVAFFKNHFPEFENKAFTCISWLLDPQLEALLRDTSNLVRFLREWYLHPFQDPGDGSIFWRVFGTRKIDIHKVPQKTTLQRAAVAHLRSGGTFRLGGSVLFAEDLDWGKQVYRRGIACPFAAA